MEHMLTLSEQDLKPAIPIINKVLDNTADAAVLVSSQRRVIYLSPGFAELTGQTMADYEEHTIDEIKIDGQEHIDQVLKDGIRKMAVPMQVGSQRLLANLVPIVSLERRRR